MSQQQDGASSLASEERSGDSRDVTTILDADATIRYVSPSIEPILGYKPEQLVGQNWFQYVHPDDAARALPGFGQATPQPGIVQRNALRVRHANGSWIRVEEVGSNLLHYPGVHGWILNARNVGTNGTANAVAPVTTGRGEDIAGPTGAREKSGDGDGHWQTELVATLSHELRTPLNVIMGYHDLLLDGTFGTLSPEQAYTLRRAHRSAREVVDIISATLDLSRIDTGHGRLLVQTIAVRDLFEELGREMRDIYDKPGVVLEWTVAPDVPKVATDPVKLKMIVKHLVRNAIQVTDQGTVTVAIRAVTDGFEIAVRDQGTGVARDALAALLEAPQPDATAFERFSGSALGLHTARRLVDLLSGRIAAETTAAGGSCIQVTIPLRAK